MQTALGALHLNTSKSTRASYKTLHASDELLCDASQILPRRQPAPWLLLDDLCANFLPVALLMEYFLQAFLKTVAININLYPHTIRNAGFIK